MSTNTPKRQGNEALKHNEVYTRRLGLRWGRLLAALDLAAHATQEAYGQSTLLKPEMQKALERILHALHEIKQAAWEEEDLEARRGQKR